jgi:uncharacterized membrane protein
VYFKEVGKMKSKYADWSNADLILQFARHFYDETKTAAKQEEQILKELAKRKIKNSL